MKCMDCGEPLTIQKQQTVAYDFGGLPDVSLQNVEVRTCTNGHREIVVPNIEGLHKAIASNLIRKRSFLAPTEIRFLRKFLGLGQADIAKRMGVAPESVSRWETGAVQMAATADRLLRMMALQGQPVEDYRALNLEVFDDLADRRDPAQLKVTRRSDKWKAA